MLGKPRYGLVCTDLDLLSIVVGFPAWVRKTIVALRERVLADSFDLTQSCPLTRGGSLEPKV